MWARSQSPAAKISGVAVGPLVKVSSVLSLVASLRFTQTASPPAVAIRGTDGESVREAAAPRRTNVATTEMAVNAPGSGIPRSQAKRCGKPL